MITGDVKWGAFLCSDVFILPSHQENFGIAVTEAMACGKAVLLSDKVNIAPDIAAAGAGLKDSDTAGRHFPARLFLDCLVAGAASGYRTPERAISSNGVTICEPTRAISGYCCKMRIGQTSAARPRPHP